MVEADDAHVAICIRLRHHQVRGDGSGHNVDIRGLERGQPARLNGHEARPIGIEGGDVQRDRTDTRIGDVEFEFDQRRLARSDDSAVVEPRRGRSDEVHRVVESTEQVDDELGGGLVVHADVAARPDRDDRPGGNGVIASVVQVAHVGAASLAGKGGEPAWGSGSGRREIHGDGARGCIGDMDPGHGCVVEPCLAVADCVGDEGAVERSAGRVQVDCVVGEPGLVGRGCPVDQGEVGMALHGTFEVFVHRREVPRSTSGPRATPRPTRTAVSPREASPSRCARHRRRQRGDHRIDRPVEARRVPVRVVVSAADHHVIADDRSVGAQRRDHVLVT